MRCGTGTGKTLAILIAALNFLHRASSALGAVDEPATGGRMEAPSVLMVLPTIPLAKQVFDWAVSITGLQPGTDELNRLVQLAIPTIENDDMSTKMSCEASIMTTSSLAVTPQMIIGVPSQFSTNPTSSSIFSLIDWNNLRLLILDEADRLLGIPTDTTSQEYTKWIANPGKTVKWLEHMFSTYWLNSRPLLVASSATLTKESRAFLSQMTGAFEGQGTAMILSDEKAPANCLVHHQYLLVDKQIDPEKEVDAFLENICNLVEGVVRNNERRSPVGKSRGLVFMSEHSGKKKIKQMLSDRGLSIQYVQEAFLGDTFENNNNENSSSDTICDETDSRYLCANADLYLTSFSEGYGLDIPNLNYVIIIGAPPDINAYLHMAGRVGRLSSRTKNETENVGQMKESATIASDDAESIMDEVSTLINESAENDIPDQSECSKEDKITSNELEGIEKNSFSTDNEQNSDNARKVTNHSHKTSKPSGMKPYYSVTTILGDTAELQNFKALLSTTSISLEDDESSIAESVLSSINSH